MLSCPFEKKACPFFTSLTPEFILAIKCFHAPMYQLAANCNFAPSILSKALSGKMKIRHADTKFVALAKLINFTGKIFLNQG